MAAKTIFWYCAIMLIPIVDNGTWHMNICNSVTFNHSRYPKIKGMPFHYTPTICSEFVISTNLDLGLLHIQFKFILNKSSFFGVPFLPSSAFLSALV